MHQRSFLFRGAALICALCMLFSGCGKGSRLEGLSAQVAELAGSYAGSDTMVTFAAEFSLDDFEGEPCHVLLLRTNDDRFFAYSYSSGQVYSPSADAVWNYDGRLETEEDRCTYLLWVSANGVSPYVNSDEARRELTVKELSEVNMALAEGKYGTGMLSTESAPDSVNPVPETTEAAVQATEATVETAPKITIPEGTGQYTVLTEYPELFTKRVLDDNAIAALKNADLETLREKISTPADFAAWIDTQDAPYYSNVTSDSRGQRTFGADFSFCWYQQMLSTPIMASIAVRVLGDDIPGIGIVAVNMDYDGGVMVCGNVIPADDGFYVFSLDTTSRRWQQTTNIMKEVFPLIRVGEVKDILAYCGSSDDVSCPGGKATQAFYIPGDTEVVLDCNYGAYTPQNPNDVVELYRDEEYIAGGEERETGHIKPEYIDRYALSGMLGGTTLTPAEAYELLDMEPEQVKERVKTAADVLMYMLAAKIGDCGGDRCKMIGGKEWHYNLNAFEVMEQRLANCGASANLANYLLEGDYEEIGFILHAYYIGDGGGHVYNYIRYEENYYIVDFSWYIFGNYRPENDFPVMKLDRLEDYGKRIPELYGGVCMALAHTSPGQHYPNVFDDGAGKYAIPGGTEYQVLYQENGPGCYQLAEYSLDKNKLDWTVFG